ncbi:MAG: metalloregulator ArsR/SmtB family transcription factor [Planctomycetes bacterium]|nr:metalloregulator ArsR/SmtB family transcription factor [Planctomycetota bacterium]
MVGTLNQLHSTLRLLADPVRLRLCALLARAELAVQELVTITGLQQSRISNHLSLLKRSGLVRDRREGTWSFHSLCEPGPGAPLTPQLYAAAVEPYFASSAWAVDAPALAAVLDQRRRKSREAHDQLAARWSELGQSFVCGTLRAEMLAAAWPCGREVADLGCGTGFLAGWLAEHEAHVVAVDHSEGMLAHARAAADAARLEFRRGDLEALPLADAEVDAAFSSLVWHHLADHDAVAREVYRVLRPGGRVVVADLLPHDCEWMRTAMGDLRLGLRPETVIGALARAGCRDLRDVAVQDRYRVVTTTGATFELAMFLVVGRKPEAAST